MNAFHDLENFVSRGQKAQAAVNKIIAAHTPPATEPAGASPGAGESQKPRSRPSKQKDGTLVEKVNASSDVAWLKSVMGSDEYQLTIRSAAQRRLGALVRKPKR